MSMTREQANDIFTPESEDKFAEQIKQLDHGTLTEAYQALNDGTYPTEKEEKIRGALLMEAAERIKALASGGFNDDELDGVSAFVAEFGNDEQKAAIGNLVEKRRSDLADAAFLDNIDAHDRGGQAFAADMNRRLTPWNGDNEYNTFLVDTVEAKRFIDAHYEDMPEGLKERTDAWLKESQDFVDVTDDQINKFAAKENEHGVLRYFDTFGRGEDGEYTAEATEFLEKVNAVRAANGEEALVLRGNVPTDEDMRADYLDSLDPLGAELAGYKREAEVQDYLAGLPEDDKSAQAFKGMMQNVSTLGETDVEFLQRQTDIKTWINEHYSEMPATVQDRAESYTSGVKKMMSDHDMLPEQLAEYAKEENQDVVQAFVAAYGDDAKPWAEQIHDERVKQGLEDDEVIDAPDVVDTNTGDENDEVIDAPDVVAEENLEEESELRKEVKAYLAKIDDNQKDNNEAEDEALKNTDLGARAYKDYVMAQLDAAEAGTEVDLSEVDLVAAYHYMAHRKQEDKEGMPAKVSEFEGKFEEEAKKAIKDKTLSLDYGVSDNIYETAKFAGFMAKYDTLGADRQPSQEAKEILQAVEVIRENMGEISLKESEFLAGTSSEELKKRD